MNEVTISLTDYSKKVEDLYPNTWILIYAKHDPIQIKMVEEKKGITIDSTNVSYGAGTNQWNAGIIILILEKIIEGLRRKYS